MLRAVYLFLALTACAPESTAATAQATPPEMEQAEAVFAGGCFWCMEKPFEALPGVLSVTSGYTGGEIEGPTYVQVSSHATQYLEAIRVVYDPDRIGYERLLEAYWHNIDPTQGDGQFCDRGHQYTSAVFVRTPEERTAATASKQVVQTELDGHPRCPTLLGGRGVPPGLLQDEPDPLRTLSKGVWPRRPTRRAVGSASGPLKRGPDRVGRQRMSLGRMPSGRAHAS